MDPSAQFCPNPACPDKGLRGHGNISVHSQKERRYRCRTCGKTFAATSGTPFYRLHHAAELMTTVVTLLALGCPLQAIVVAFGLDERTVRTWWLRAGHHSEQEQVHTHLVQAGQVDLGHVQADELWVKMYKGRVWQAMALAVPSRLWLGGLVRAHRDEALIMSLMQRVRACARSLVVVVCVDGLASYVTVVRRVFRVRVLTGKPGRPRLVLPPTVLLAQVIKHTKNRRVVGVTQWVVVGTAEAVERFMPLPASQATAHPKDYLKPSDWWVLGRRRSRRTACPATSPFSRQSCPTMTAPSTRAPMWRRTINYCGTPTRRWRRRRRHDDTGPSARRNDVPRACGGRTGSSCSVTGTTTAGDYCVSRAERDADDDDDTG